MTKDNLDLSLQARQSISIETAKQISITTNTPPLMPSLSPRWLLRLLTWVDVPTGTYRINQVKYLNDVRRIALPEHAFTTATLRFIPLFKLLPEALLKEVFTKMHTEETKRGDAIIKQGEENHQALYIILEGNFDVSVIDNYNKKVVIKTLGAGDYFGEMALLKNVPRRATITATTKGKLICLDKIIFDQIRSDPEANKQLNRIYEARSEELSLVNQCGESQAPLISGEEGEPFLPRGFVDYYEESKEIQLSVIQTTIGINTRISEIYNTPYNQLEQQLRITIENIREREEWEIINNKDFGLLHNIDSEMVVLSKNGAPTPDDLDNLLALVWKIPSFFLAHPKAIAAFGMECTYRGVPPPTVELFGAQFIAWRGIPLIPSSKLMLNFTETVPTTDILLLRTGMEEQGVVGLHKASIGTSHVPSLSVQFMGINERSVASYLLTKYFSAAILVPDAIGVLKNVSIGSYHSYATG